MVSLSFSQREDGMYVASFESSGDPVVVQLQRAGSGGLAFKANIGSMVPQIIRSFSQFNTGTSFITTVNVPAGVTVTIESESEVTSGGYEG